MQTTRIKLMIVDDHAETRRLIRELTGSFVSEIRECADGQEAAEQCEDFHPDLVTMDLNMPLTAGLEATRRILAYHPDARVIVLTHSDTLEFRRAASRAGACHFFSKNNIVGLLRYLEQRARFLTGQEPVCT